MFALCTMYYVLERLEIYIFVEAQNYDYVNRDSYEVCRNSTHLDIYENEASICVKSK